MYKKTGQNRTKQDRFIECPEILCYDESEKKKYLKRSLENGRIRIFDFLAVRRAGRRKPEDACKMGQGRKIKAGGRNHRVPSKIHRGAAA